MKSRLVFCYKKLYLAYRVLAESPNDREDEAIDVLHEAIQELEELIGPEALRESGTRLERGWEPGESGERTWLIAIRKERGFSQKYVSEQIGLAQPSYCTIERGKTSPTVETAKAIAQVLGFDWTRFYGEESA